eukprot:CAMPEP_0117025784 /NCGR_PEP_ID=MMETSP0472-20121206/19016_1 /TAXON_ID=693140 ORGANISM="Tiarina fusus, Strain LIS" /NCGR_SAMPLE_ID=MMETSP0472 /ASSEMBLY_ACC=CAM_ASM_000603 /LENGTH=373 /DNA_ID=CAMNT_0004732603 /DNA_START=17 /DNA_END=1138 /DNA_ORIENTATION=+
MSFLKKVSTNVARAKQMAMAKVGQAEATVDAQFNQLETMFKEQYHKMKKLTKYVQSYQSAIADLGNAQQGMSQMIIDQYEPTDSMFTVASRLKDEASVKIEQHRDQMEKYYAENFYQPIERYLVQYKLIEERINERNTRLIDMDRYNGEVKALMSRTDTVPTKLQVAKDKADAKRMEYGSLNEELIQDIQKLIADRSRFFDALFANLVQGQTEYLAGSAQSLSAIDASFVNVNRTAVRNWARCITDPAQSAFRGASAAEVCGQSSPAADSAYDPNMNMGSQSVSNSSFDPNASAPSGISLDKGFGSPAPVAAAAPVAAVVRAKALYPFQGQDASELTFQFNEEIIVLRQGGEWWEGELNGRRGLFPSNYVKLC